jgi:hypothetical protein
MVAKLSKLFLNILLLCGVFSLKLQLVDEDYVIVQIGYPPKEYKLIVDPVGPFTYLFKENNSTSKLDGELSGTHEFQNVFGNFSGVWKNDFFYLTTDRLMNFRMDYLEIQKKETKLKCDGVLGLGYSFQQSYGNIYEVLEKMYNVFKSKKMVSYDKKKITNYSWRIPRT